MCPPTSKPCNIKDRFMLPYDSENKFCLFKMKKTFSFCIKCKSQVLLTITVPQEKNFST